jgi:hypothetical protein
VSTSPRYVVILLILMLADSQMLRVTKQGIANIMVIPLVDSYMVRVTTHRVGLG